MSDQESPNLKGKESLKRRAKDNNLPKIKKKCESKLKTKKTDKKENTIDEDLFLTPLVVQNEINANQDKSIIEHPKFPDLSMFMNKIEQLNSCIIGMNEKINSMSKEMSLLANKIDSNTNDGKKSENFGVHSIKTEES